MRRWLIFGSSLAMLLLMAQGIHAQTCRGEKANRKGTARADIAISNTAVTIADRNTSRCALWISNNGGNAMRCSDVTNDGAPTATAGIEFASGKERTIIDSAQGLWQCINVSLDADTTANVSESLP